jgi:hypothetical protein
MSLAPCGGSAGAAAVESLICLPPLNTVQEGELLLLLQFSRTAHETITNPESPDGVLGINDS